VDRFDFIIGGAGSAGCVLAKRLSVNPRKRVLLLEAGGSDRRFWIRTPIGYGKTFYDQAVNWKYPVTTRHGLRCSAVDAFLRPAMQRANLVVRTGVLVRRVVIEGARAVGVEYQVGGRGVRAAATDEVVLSAGAINAPQLLQLSGVGPAELLRRHGIAVASDNPAVGGGLRDHLGISYFYRASEPTLNGVLGSWRGRIGAGLQFLLQRSGPLSLSVNQMGGMVRSDPSLPRPDIQLYFSPISYTTETTGKRPLLRPDPYPGFMLGFNACRSSSTGRIDIASGDPAAPPRIVPNYLSTEQDIRAAISGARLIGRPDDTVHARTDRRRTCVRPGSGVRRGHRTGLPCSSRYGLSPLRHLRHAARIRRWCCRCRTARLWRSRPSRR